MITLKTFQLTLSSNAIRAASRYQRIQSIHRRPFANMAKIHTPIPDLKLNDGNSIPMLAFGTGTAWYKTSAGDLDQACIDSAKTAIGLGYYHLDGAEVYKTEPELGTAIKESGVARDKIFLTTKVMTNMSDIPGALKASLKKLQTDYVDLYLIHAPFFSENKAEHQAKWKQLEELKAQGLAKSIGVSNYTPKQLDWILETCSVPPAINQVEFHPYLQHAELIKYHKEKGIATAAYGPLSAITKASPGPADDVLQSLAKKYAVSTGEICLRWCVDQDVVPITTSSKEQRLSDYLRAMTFKLTPKEIQDLNEAGNQKHFRAFFNDKYESNDRT